MKKIFLGFLIMTLVISGCKQEDVNAGGNSSTTVEQDKQFLSNTITSTLTCINNIKDGESVQALLRFLSLSDGVVENESWLDKMTEELDLAMNEIVIDENTNKFNFSKYWGNYEWNRTTQKFTKSFSSVNGIFIKFPSEPMNLTNNVSINFTTFVDALYKANAEDVYLPTTVKLNMTKDGTELVNLDYSGNFSSGSFPTPIKLNLFLKISPQTYSVTIERITDLQFSMKADLIGSDCNTQVVSTVTFLNNDYNNLDVEEDLSMIDLSVKKGDLTIKGVWDAKAFYSYDDPTTNEMNSTIKCEVFNKASKVGDLKFKDVNDETKVFIYYKDFSSEDVTKYTDQFVNGFTNIMRPYFGNDVDSWFE